MFALAKPESAADKIYRSAIFVRPPPGFSIASVAEQVRVRDLDPSGRAIIVYSNSGNDERTITVRHFQEKVPNALTIGFRKGSDLKPLFDYQIIKMRNSGLLDKIANDNSDRQAEEASCDFGDGLAPVGMDGLYLPLALIGVGALLGACLAVMEVGERSLAIWMSRKVPHKEVPPSPCNRFSSFGWLTSTFGVVDSTSQEGASFALQDRKRERGKFSPKKKIMHIQYVAK